MKELTWHYRSQSESLIAFSNERYYGGRLITFPALETRHRAVGYAPSGVYERGGNRVNRAEARAVVDDLTKRLSRALRIDTPSALGPWSYEVVDTKLASETRAGTVLQLCLYAELVADVQRLRPEHGYVVPPHSGYEVYSMDDYRAYFRRVRDSLMLAVASGDPPRAYPDPCQHCDICLIRQVHSRYLRTVWLGWPSARAKIRAPQIRARQVRTRAYSDIVAGRCSIGLKLSDGPSKIRFPAIPAIRAQS